jgi:hypothetical protein
MKNAPQKTAFQSCLEQADRLGLYAIDQQLQIMARTAGNSPGSLQEKVEHSSSPASSNTRQA